MVLRYHKFPGLCNDTFHKKNMRYAKKRMGMKVCMSVLLCYNLSYQLHILLVHAYSRFKFQPGPAGKKYLNRQRNQQQNPQVVQGIYRSNGDMQEFREMLIHNSYGKYFTWSNFTQTGVVIWHQPKRHALRETPPNKHGSHLTVKNTNGDWTIKLAQHTAW